MCEAGWGEGVRACGLHAPESTSNHTGVSLAPAINTLEAYLLVEALWLGGTANSVTSLTKGAMAAANGNEWMCTIPAIMAD